jgi:hypothetical protein
MLLLVMIVFCVLGFTIAVVPVLAMTVHEHRAQARAALGAERRPAVRRGPSHATTRAGRRGPVGVT